jgi:hypothetical protein
MWWCSQICITIFLKVGVTLLQSANLRVLATYSQNFMFFVTYELTQEARVGWKGLPEKKTLAYFVHP